MSRESVNYYPQQLKQLVYETLLLFFM